MKIVAVFGTVALILICQTDHCRSCSDDSWQMYKKEFNKRYTTLEEDFKRRSVFCENLEMIHDHNEKYSKGEVTYEMGINQFADWTHEEFHHWLNGVESVIYPYRRTVSVSI